MRKLHFVSVTPDGNNNLFRRNAYRLLEDSHTSMHLTLIQYLGDEKIDYPHGNSKSTNQPKLFIRTISAEVVVWKELFTIRNVQD